MRIIIVMLIIGCIKNNLKYDSKYKNDIDYYFNNLDKLDKKKLPYIIEKAEEGNNKALFLYIYLLNKNPSNKKLNSKMYLLKNIKNFIDYLYNNNYFKELGYLYSKGIKGEMEPNANKAIEYYNKAIDMGNSDAANNLGALYKDGVEGQLEANADKAIKYYNKAIDMGNSDAVYNLGILYADGIEGQLKPNINKVIEYYNEAIAMGVSDAAYNLGILYENGIKEQLEPNINKAIEYYNKAIDMDDSDAANNLAELYKDGVEGQLEANAGKAIKYYNKAIDMGNSDAVYNLGILYTDGIKGQLEPDISKAIEYYNKAIDMGNSNAANNLAILYNDGMEGQLEANAGEAIKYYNKAIDMGDFNAVYNLAILYKDGIEGQLDPNISKAIEYYNKAKQMGNDVSDINLNDLYNKLIKEKLNISINEVVKCAFELYDKYNYKHNIIKEIFTLNDNMETDDRANYNLGVIKYISNLYSKYSQYIVNKIFISDNKPKENNNDNEDVMETYINNIKECYGIVLGQKIANDSNSTISSFKHNSINNDLFVSYNYICNYLESLIELLKYFDNHNFMIDCIKLEYRSNAFSISCFNSVEEDYLNVLNAKGKDYICIGENEGYSKLLDITSKKEQLLNNINKVTSNINSNTDLYYALREIINIEDQLYDILVHTASSRNKGFLNKYIDLFK